MLARFTGGIASRLLKLIKTRRQDHAVVAIGLSLTVSLAGACLVGRSDLAMAQSATGNDPFVAADRSAAGVRTQSVQSAIDSAIPAQAATDDDRDSDGASAFDARQDSPNALRRLDRLDEDDDGPAPGARVFVQDGDLDVIERQAPQDGVYSSDEAEQPADGDLAADGLFGIFRDPSLPVDDADAGSIDTLPGTGLAGRNAAQARFRRLNRPVGGSIATRDADARIDPSRERSPDPLQRANPDARPYDALGVRIGSFLFFPEVEATTVHTDNVFQAAGAKRSDNALELRPSFRLRSDWSNHALELNGSALRSWHREFESEDDRQYDVGANGRIDITRRTNIEGEINYAVTQESRSAVDAVQGAVERPDVETLSGAVTGNHRFNRLSLQLRGAAADVSNGDAVLADGTVNSQSSEDYLVRSLALRMSYEFSPAFTAFIDGTINDRDYNGLATDGFSRDSEGWEVRGGISGELTPTVRGEIALGHLRQQAVRSQLSDVEGIVIDANVAWAPTALTTIVAAASTDFSGTTLTDSLGAISRAASVSVQHELRRNFVLTAGLAWTHTDYEGVALEEEQWEASLAAEYLFTRELALTGRYVYTDFNSSAIGRDYDENRVEVGVRMRR